MSDVVASLRELFEAHGGETYMEDVTLLQHSLQTAALAQQEGAPGALVVAALLHDVGHFLEARDDAYGYHAHAEAGAKYLQKWFGEEVTEPVRLHVLAKRYLCAKEPEYFAKLSKASVHSLQKQGGAMNEEEMLAFEGERYFREAICLRRWDDGGKRVGEEVALFSAYEDLLREKGLPQTP